MSISVISGQGVAKAGVVSIHDLGDVVPGVQINFAGCCTQPAIRGISTLTTGIGYENNVAVYVDGFYAPDNVAINNDLANIASVEVLKGPQGTLYGRNATGGAILINTLAPSDTLGGKAVATYGRFNDYSLSGYVSGPINDHLRFGIAAYGHHSDGYNHLLDANGNRISDAASPIRQASVRAKLEWEVNSDLTATLAYNYGLSGDPRGDLFKYIAHSSAALPKSPPRASAPFDVSENRQAVLDAITNEVTLTLALTTSIGTLKSYTGYAHRHTHQAYDLDGSYLDLNESNQYWNQDTFQETLDYNITAVKNVDLVVGAAYFNDDIGTADDRTFINFVQSSALATDLKSESWAAYIDGSYHLTDRLTLSAGGRYSRETKHGSFTQFTAANAISATMQNDATFTAFTPRASVRYEIAPRTNVYATVAQGFRSGGFPTSGATSQALYLPYRPEKITSYELGFKTSGSNYQFSTAAFYYDYRDLQVGLLVPNPNGNGTIITLVANAKRAEVTGIDSDLNFQPIENLNVHLGGAYLHARYTDFHNAVGTGLNATTGLNVSNQAQDWSGHQMIRAPGLSGMLGVDYTFEGVAGGSLNVGGNAHATSSFVINNASLFGPLSGALANTQRFRQGAYTLVNLQATWTAPSGHLHLGVFGDNVTNKTYKMTYNGTGFGDYASYGAPATYGMRIGYDF